MKHFLTLLIGLILTGTIPAKSNLTCYNVSVLKDTIEYKSKIRPHQKMFIPGKEYSDIITFKEFNDDYDYAYSLFITKTGDIATLYHEDKINDNYKGKKLKVKWKLNQYFEAGEGDEPYYKEQLVSYELAE